MRTLSMQDLLAVAGGTRRCAKPVKPKKPKCLPKPKCCKPCTPPVTPEEPPVDPGIGEG